MKNNIHLEFIKLPLIIFSFICGMASAQTPTITSFAPTSGPIGTTVTIAGTNFNTTLANNIVFFGATKATVSVGSATSLTVVVPTGASFHPISVTNITTGLTAYSARPFNVTFPCGGAITGSSKVDFSSQGPMSVATGDLDGDGKTDFAVANYGNTVSVFRNTGSSGTISFALSVNYTTGTHPYCVSIGDMDGDGKLDLAVVNYNSNTVSVFRNTGSSGTISFAAKVDFATGTNPHDVSTSDLDGDGKLDLTVANYASNTLSILRNTGSSGMISFAPKVDFTTGTNPMSLATGDLDGDGKPDLAIAHEGSNAISVLRNISTSGTISFAPKVDFATWAYPVSVSIGDLNGDGKPDLANVNAGVQTISVHRNTSSIGTMSFAPAISFPAGITPNSILTTDFNGDGKPDLAVAHSGSNNASIFRNTSSGSTISFATKVDFAAGVSTRCVASGDFDGDDKLDLAAGNSSVNTVSLFRNSIPGVPPTVTANATATTVCSGASITLSGGGAHTYVWTGGVSNGVGFVPPTGTTTYTVTGTDTVTTCQSTDTKTITVNPLPTVTANATATIVCAGTNITLSGGGTANTYTWSGGVTNGLPFAPPVGSNTYTFTGTITSTGCKNTATINIIVHPNPTASTSSTNNTKCSGICNGTATALGSGGTSPYSYLWASAANNQNTATATGLCMGPYTVTITDAKGCSIPKNVSVGVTAVANSNIFLTNLAAIDQINVSPSFASYYGYNLPSSITPPPSNPRNFVDPGKKARFKVECTNKKGNGQSIVSGICKVRSNSLFFTISDSSSALNNIGWNNKAWSADEFEIDIDPNTPPGTNAYIDFVVQENGINYTTSCIAIPIRPLVYSQTTSSTIDDDNNPDSRGNDNDICDTNEIIEFYPWLNNTSQLNAEYVRGKLENLDNHNFINIWNGVAGVGTTVYNSTWWNFGFGKPQTISSSAQNTTPEYDFVFNYGNPNTKSNFNLYMVMAGGFKLFSDTALSLVQWSLPYTFTASGTPDMLTLDKDTLYLPNSIMSSLINVSSNRNWTVSSNQSWATVNTSSGTGNGSFTITSTANSGPKRNAIITVSAGSIIKNILVIQDAYVGLNELNIANTIGLYPNPSPSIFTIENKGNIEYDVQVFDVNGRLLDGFNILANQKRVLDYGHLNEGVYLMKVGTGVSHQYLKLFLIK